MTLAQPARTALDHTAIWTNLHDADLRGKALKAAAERDEGTLLSLLQAYTDMKSASGRLTSPHTLRSYVTGVRMFLRYADTQGFDLVKPGRHAGQRFIGHLASQNLKPASIQSRVAAASALYRALQWSGATTAEPFRNVVIPADRTHGVVKRPPYTEEEIIGALHAADPHTRFLLLLTAHAGLRISEALQLTWADLDPEARRITVWGKGRKTRVVAMSASLAAATQTYLLLHPPGGRACPPKGRRTTDQNAVFWYTSPQNARHHLSKAFREAGAHFRGFHPGRKYAGTKLLREIRDYGRVAAHLGHENIDTTRRGYAVPADDDLQDVMAQW